jgi:hypothetical protein
VVLYFDPALGMTFPEDPLWSVNGSGSIDSEAGAATTLTAFLSPGSATVKVRVRDVSLPTTFSVIAPSQVVPIPLLTQNISLGTENPAGTQMGADTLYWVSILPSTVSFGNVSFRESPDPASINVTWPNGTNQTIPFQRTSFNYPCGAQAKPDNQKVGLYPKANLFTGTAFAGCSFSDTWNYQYLNQAGQWANFCPITATITFISSGQCQVTYLGVPGSSQGPY